MMQDGLVGNGSQLNDGFSIGTYITTLCSVVDRVSYEQTEEYEK